MHTKSDDKSTTIGYSSEKRGRVVALEVECIDEEEDCDNAESEFEE